MLVVVMFVAAIKSRTVGMREKQMKMRTSRDRSFAPGGSAAGPGGS